MTLFKSHVHTWTAAIAGTIALFSAAPAKALSLQNTSGVTAPAQTITFNEIVLSQGASVSTAYSGLGVTFSGNLLYDSTDYGLPNFTPAQLVNYGTGIGPIAIFFNTAQNQAAFTARTNPGTSTFTALLGGVVVETFNATTDSTRSDNFYGFTGITFDQIQVAPGGVGNGLAIDNLQLGTVPVPFGFTPIPGLAVSGILWSLNRLKKKLNSVMN